MHIGKFPSRLLLIMIIIKTQGKDAACKPDQYAQ